MGIFFFFRVQGNGRIAVLYAKYQEIFEYTRRSTLIVPS